MKIPISKRVSQPINVIWRCIGLSVVGIALNLGAVSIVQAATDCSVVTEISPAECESLLELYNSTDGVNWGNNEGWNVTDTPCSWYGVTCLNGGVSKIDLHDNQLIGTIPDFSALPNLEVLYIHENELTGTIPDFSALSNLTKLDLSSNQLTGTIPDFSALPNFELLYLYNNQLTGAIPSSNTFINLTYLDLRNNPLCKGININYSIWPIKQAQLNDDTSWQEQLNEFPSCEQSPTAEFTISPSQGNAPLTVTLDASNSVDPFGSISSYTWTINGQTFSGETKEKTFNEPGEHIIVLTVKDNDGNEATAQKTVTVTNQVPTASFTASPLSGKAPLTVKLDASASKDTDGTIANYKWTSSDGKTLSGVKPTITFSKAGAYTIGLVVTDNNGAKSTNTAQQSIKVESQRYTLTINNTGNGDVTGNGINCGSDCDEEYDENTSVTLTAKADADSIFDGWGGACSGTGSCNVTMSEVQEVTATFKIKGFPLTVNKSGTGTGSVTGNGINCGSDCSKIYEINTSVTLTPTADADSRFVGWSGVCSGTGNCTVTMNQAQNVIATFEPKPIDKFLLTISEKGNGNGIVTSSPSGINCGSGGNDCGEEYDNNPVITLKAKADADSIFEGWGGDCSGDAATCVVKMSSDKTVTASFDLCKYTVKPTNQTHKYNADNGSITVEVSNEKCPWAAISHNDDWLKITSPKDNHGNGEIDYSVADNSNTEDRKGTLTIAGQEVSIYQGIYEKPTASFTASPLSGMAPLTVKLDASDSYDPDGEIKRYEWTTSDEQTALGKTAELTFAGDKSCQPTITLTVTDNDDLSAQAEETISLENCTIIEFQGIEDYYRVGDFVRAEVKIDVNVGRFKRVDLWVAISMPSGELIYRTPLGINEFSPIAQAFKESLESQTVVHRLLDFEVPPGLGGTYIFYALIVDEGEDPMEHLDELVIQETALAN
ncbi:MAG: hypothetical protein DRQ41_10985 [Gammaproteobacteria bacterium]|nr:MAG: hypothetical protein DRQ41_10985 [Gammaproteobacteria bacterium]